MSLALWDATRQVGLMFSHMYMRIAGGPTKLRRACGITARAEQQRAWDPFLREAQLGDNTTPLVLEVC